MKKSLFAYLLLPLIAMSFSQSAFAQSAKAEAKPAPPLIAASSDLQQALPVIARLFEQAGGEKVTLQFGAPGDIYQQINGGAPIELFFAGDEFWANKIVEDEKALKESRPYAVAALALYVPRNSSLKADPMLGDIRSALREGRLQQLIIADPKVSPYGRIAEQALRRKLAWDDVQNKLVVANNAIEVSQRVKESMVQGGLISHAQARKVVHDNGGRAIMLSEVVSDPLIQHMVLLKDASRTSQLFFDFMQRREAKKILLDYGFKLPGGETASMLGY